MFAWDYFPLLVRCAHLAVRAPALRLVLAALGQSARPPYILRLVFGLRGPKTPVRGMDVAGVVVASGDHVTGFALGDEVFGSSWAKKKRKQAGTFAELTKVPAGQLAHKP